MAHFWRYYVLHSFVLGYANEMRGFLNIMASAPSQSLGRIPTTSFERWKKSSVQLKPRSSSTEWIEGASSLCIDKGASAAKFYDKRAKVATIQKTASRWYPFRINSRLPSITIGFAASVISGVKKVS
jgi:hypothetical protein